MFMNKICFLIFCLITLNSCKKECRKIGENYNCLLSDATSRFANGMGDTLVFQLGERTSVCTKANMPIRTHAPIEYWDINYQTNGGGAISYHIGEKLMFIGINDSSYFYLSFDDIDASKCNMKNVRSSEPGALYIVGDTTIGGVLYPNVVHIVDSDSIRPQNYIEAWVQGEAGLVQYRDKNGQTFHRIKP